MLILVYLKVIVIWNWINKINNVCDYYLCLCIFDSDVLLMLLKCLEMFEGCCFRCWLKFGLN